MKRLIPIAVLTLSCVAWAASPASTVAPTFSKDVAAIFYKNCVDCHRPGEAAPMSLLNYKDARPWIKSIREKVTDHVMPPWQADPHFGKFSNDRRLQQKDIDTIVAWIDAGAREGDGKDLPKKPEYP